VHIELVKPDGDKLRRANAWSPLVEDGTVLFGPGQKQLIDAMLAVPADKSQWDLVDAAGLCVRGFPKIAPESERLPEFEPTAALAASYAVRPQREAQPMGRPRPFARTGQPRELKRAGGYAVRRPTPAPPSTSGAGR
jgi:hypothetical protein